MGQTVWTVVVTMLIGRGAVELDLLDHLEMHPVIHVSRPTLYVEQPAGIAILVTESPALINTEEGDKPVAENILAYRRTEKFLFSYINEGRSST